MRKFKTGASTKNQTVHDELVPKTENVVGAARRGREIPSTREERDEARREPRAGVSTSWRN